MAPCSPKRKRSCKGSKRCTWKKSRGCLTKKSYRKSGTTRRRSRKSSDKSPSLTAMLVAAKTILALGQAQQKTSVSARAQQSTSVSPSPVIMQGGYYW